MLKDQIHITDLEKLDIRVGTIVAAERVIKSTSLLKLTVDFGVQIGTRQILTGMQKFYDTNYFVGIQTIFCVNLEPRNMMGLESQGMILALGLSNDKKPVFLTPKENIENGEGVR